MEKIVWFGEYIPLPRFLKDEAETFSFLMIVDGEVPVKSTNIEDIGNALKEKVLLSFVSPPTIIEESIVVRKDYKDPDTGEDRTGSIGWKAKISLEEDSIDFKLNPFKLDGK